MKKIILACTLATSMLIVSACSDKEEASNVIASTKAGDITEHDLYVEMKDSIGNQALESLILFKVIENEYEVTDNEIQEEIEISKEQFGENYELFLTANNLTEQSYEKSIRSQMFQRKMIESLDEVTDEEIEAAYEKSKKEIHARHILVEDEKTAEEVRTKLTDGGDFEELAKEYSTEPAAQSSGGDLGWFGAGKMVAPFEEASYSLNKGEISEPVKTVHGFHIIEVLDTRDVEPEGTLEEMQEKLEEQITARLFEDKLIALLKAAEVDIKNEDFESVLKTYLAAD